METNLIPILESGHAFHYTGLQVFLSDDELWITKIAFPNGTETYIGHRQIDGRRCNIFRDSVGDYWGQVESK